MYGYIDFHRKKFSVADMEASDEDIDLNIQAAENRKKDESKSKSKNQSRLTFDIKREMKAVEKINKETFALLKQRLNINDDQCMALCAITGLNDLNQVTQRIEKLQLGV